MTAATCNNPRRWRVVARNGFRPCGQSYIIPSLVGQYMKRRSKIIRPPTGVAERRPGGLFHVMRRIIQGSVSHTIRISEVWLTKD